MLSREDLVAVATRLFSIYLLVEVVIFWGSSYSQIAESSGHIKTLAYLLAFSIPAFAAGALLWFFPLTISRKLLPAMKEPASPLDWKSASAMELSMAILGLWLVARAIGDFFYWTFLAFLTVKANGNWDSFGPENMAGTIATIIEIAIGTWLILGHRGILRVISHIRGHEK